MCDRLLYLKIVATIFFLHSTCSSVCVLATPMSRARISLLSLESGLALITHCSSMEWGRSGAMSLLWLDQRRSCSIHLLPLEYSPSRCCLRGCTPPYNPVTMLGKAPAAWQDHALNLQSIVSVELTLWVLPAWVPGIWEKLSDDSRPSWSSHSRFQAKNPGTVKQRHTISTCPA